MNRAVNNNGVDELHSMSAFLAIVKALCYSVLRK